jgi:hypothetical protein
MKDIVNPVSTKTTESFGISIVDRLKRVVNIKDTEITVTTGIPFPIPGADAKITPSNPWPGVATEFEIEFTPKHEIEVGGGILIVYPPQITPNPDEEDDAVVVTVDGQVVDQLAINQVHSPPARSFTIKEVIQGSKFIPSTFRKIKLKIKGLRNPRQPNETDSFIVSTFNHDIRQTYMIDQVSDGLFIKALCAYPCKDCETTNKSTCTECFSNLADGLKYLQLGRCVSKCAVGRFYNLKTKHCDLCDDTCLDCEGTADTCTVCGKNDYLYLFKSTCRRDCNVIGYLKNS